jgi:acyl-CoA thioester hydrolase
MRFPLEARYRDYDRNGHVNNAVFLTYFEVARERAWRQLTGQITVYPYIIAEATIRYASEARLGEALEIEIAVEEVRTKAWVWTYTIRAVAHARIVATGTTVQVMYDYERKQTRPIPPELAAALRAAARLTPA